LVSPSLRGAYSMLGVASRKMSSKPKESDEVFDARWQAYFSRYGQLVCDSILILLYCRPFAICISQAEWIFKLLFFFFLM